MKTTNTIRSLQRKKKVLDDKMDALIRHEKGINDR